MNTTTTTTTTDETVVDYGFVTARVDAVIVADGAAFKAWVELFDACESADDVKAAWKVAREHYGETFPRGRSGKTTDPMSVFKARKSDVKRIRAAHPKMTPDALVTAYGSVNAAVRAVRTGPAAEPKQTTEPTAAERIAAVDAAVRLALGSGVDADAIRSAVDAALAA